MAYLDEVGALLHEVVGQAATFRGISVTVRLERGAAEEAQTPRAHVDEITATAWLRLADVATVPLRDEAITVASGAWAGTWRLDGQGEPTAQSEWRCSVRHQTTAHSMAPSHGHPRRT